jgi:SanA protein
MTKITLLKLSKMSLLLASLLLLFILGCNYWVLSTAKGKMFNNLADVEPRDVALVLGTSRSPNGKTENLFFTYRIKAAAELYFSGKVKHIIVSGDNSSINYNEPRDMQKALIKLGVPKSAITLDYAGLRTLDSVVRCKEIFQQQKVIIVSQEFHNYRALFIAQHHNIDAIAYNALQPNIPAWKTTIREYFARPKAVIDVCFLDAQPKHLGDKIDIEIQP